jgi:uncharacterized protein YidB (DUF937 family)
MSRGSPSMVALLGLLAVAGYQNRDKIREMLGGRSPGAGSATGSAKEQNPQGGLLGSLGGFLGGASAGGVLSSGLRDLIDRFKQTGHAEAADSWVNTGPNQTIGSDHLEQAIGPGVLATLTEQTGLSREELLARLTRDLPGAVDKFSPQGRLPTEEEAGRLI